ncbi:hypothetical protein Hanom_Chr03g00180231 [Helianthus anomalus]
MVEPALLVTFGTFVQRFVFFASGSKRFKILPLSFISITPSIFLSQVKVFSSFLLT